MKHTVAAKVQMKTKTTEELGHMGFSLGLIYIINITIAKQQQQQTTKNNNNNKQQTTTTTITTNTQGDVEEIIR